MSQAYRAAVAVLEQMAAQPDGLANDAVACLKLLRLQAAAAERLPAAPGSPSTQQAEDRLREGRPLLDFDQLSIAWDLLPQLLVEILECLGGPALPAGAFDRAWLVERVRRWYEGQPVESLTAVPAELLARALGEAVRPFLVACAEALSSDIDGQLWRRAYCPVCGGQPDMAFLEGETGSRWLVCGRCDCQWLFQRMQCPFCGNQDQESLGFFASDDAGGYRLYVCDRCRGYVKAVDLRVSQGQFLAPLQRCVTLPMDGQAQEAGYTPGRMSSGWREGPLLEATGQAGGQQPIS